MAAEPTFTSGSTFGYINNDADEWVSIHVDSATSDNSDGSYAFTFPDYGRPIPQISADEIINTQPMVASGPDYAYTVSTRYVGEREQVLTTPRTPVFFEYKYDYEDSFMIWKTKDHFSGYEDLFEI